MVRNLRELYRYRALLWALTLRELRARYRSSVLGFLWTFLNPTLNMVVYYVVFQLLMKTHEDRYAYSLFCGLLPWIYFSTSVIGGTSAVSDRRDLLTKVHFPAQVLPATVVFTNMVNFGLSLPLLWILGGVFGDVPSWHVVFAIPVLIVQTIFTMAVVYLLSALNVTFRDLQHVVSNVIQMAFFVSPVFWKLEQLPPDLQQVALYVNPLVPLISAWRQIFFEHRIPDAQPLLMVTGLSLVLFWLSTQVFERRREEFAELV